MPRATGEGRRDLTRSGARPGSGRSSTRDPLNPMRLRGITERQVVGFRGSRGGHTGGIGRRAIRRRCFARQGQERSWPSVRRRRPKAIGFSSNCRARARTRRSSSASRMVNGTSAPPSGTGTVASADSPSTRSISSSVVSPARPMPPPRPASTASLPPARRPPAGAQVPRTGSARRPRASARIPRARADGRDTRSYRRLRTPARAPPAACRRLPPAASRAR